MQPVDFPIAFWVPCFVRGFPVGLDALPFADDVPDAPFLVDDIPDTLLLEDDVPDTLFLETERLDFFAIISSFPF